MNKWYAGPAKSNTQINPSIGYDSQKGLPSLYSNFKKVIMYIPKHVRMALLKAIKLSDDMKKMNINRHVVSGLRRNMGISNIIKVISALPIALYNDMII